MSGNENNLVGGNGLASNLLGGGYNLGKPRLPLTQSYLGTTYNDTMVNTQQPVERYNSVAFKSPYEVLKTNGDENGWIDTVKDWFTPQGASGASTAGNLLSGVGTAVGIGSGLAGMYYASKKAKLDKERAGMEKDVYNRSVQRDSENEARMQQLAKNVGNDAFYKA